MSVHPDGVVAVPDDPALTVLKNKECPVKDVKEPGVSDVLVVLTEENITFQSEGLELGRFPRLLLMVLIYKRPVTVSCTTSPELYVVPTVQGVV